MEIKTVEDLKSLSRSCESDCGGSAGHRAQKDSGHRRRYDRRFTTIVNEAKFENLLPRQKAMKIVAEQKSKAQLTLQTAKRR